MHSEMNLSVLVVGHVCYDLRYGKKLLGGPALFMYPVLNRVFHRIAFLTSADPEFPFPNGVDLRVEPSDVSTVFRYEEDCEEDRCMHLLSRAADIVDLPEDRFDVVIVSGLAGEIRTDRLKQLSDLGRVSIIDMQTLVRDFGEDGTVLVRVNRGLEEAVSVFDYVKASDQEVNVDIPVAGLMITSASGVEFHGDKVTHYPTRLIQETVDTTGSGDVFIAGFASALAMGAGVDAAIDLGNRVAGINTMYEGIPPSDAFGEEIDSFRERME